MNNTFIDNLITRFKGKTFSEENDAITQIVKETVLATARHIQEKCKSVEHDELRYSWIEQDICEYIIRQCEQ